MRAEAGGDGAPANAELEAADMICRRAAARFDAGQECGADANMAKLLASDQMPKIPIRTGLQAPSSIAAAVPAVRRAKAHTPVKIFVAMAKLVLAVIMADNGRPEHGQGDTLSAERRRASLPSGSRVRSLWSATIVGRHSASEGGNRPGGVGTEQ
jgi:ferric-dicitrate binding protein FerR (iron transport regulator)